MRSAGIRECGDAGTVFPSGARKIPGRKPPPAVGQIHCVYNRRQRAHDPCHCPVILIPEYTHDEDQPFARETGFHRSAQPARGVFIVRSVQDEQRLPPADAGEPPRPHGPRGSVPDCPITDAVTEFPECAHGLQSGDEIVRLAAPGQLRADCSELRIGEPDAAVVRVQDLCLPRIRLGEGTAVLCGTASQDVCHRGALRRRDHRTPRFDDACLVLCDLLQSIPDDAYMVHADRSEYSAHRAGDDVRRVQGASKPCLQHDEIAFHAAEI